MMESYRVFVLISVLSTTSSIPPTQQTKEFRTDYVYNRRTDAFYKLHIEGRSASMAGEVCQTEGSLLMAAESQADIAQLHMMLKKYPDLENLVWVGTDRQPHESDEEEPIINLDRPEDTIGVRTPPCLVANRQGSILEDYHCHRSRPFICKVVAKYAPYNSNCDVFSSGYVYVPSVNSCYRISPVAYSWNEAYAECRAERAHLVILNSETEREAVQNLTHNSPRAVDSRANWFYYAGYRAEKPVANETVVFKTIFNQTLVDAGFDGWSPNEPNNDKGREYCGTIFRNDGKLNDVDCSHEYAFICEKEKK